MKQILLTCCLVLSITACKHHKDYEKRILGEWKFIKELPKTRRTELSDIRLAPHGNSVNGYKFGANQICENKLGYFKQIPGENQGDERSLFLGNTTNYKIEDDSLKIFNLSRNIWVGTKIYGITPDTLTLEVNDSTLALYAKLHDSIPHKPFFDQLIVSSSGCYGSCPIGDILISKTGEVVFNGQSYNTRYGLFTSTLSKAQFDKIESDFGKAHIEKLDENYASSWTDDEEISISFIKDKKIVKTITDYGRKAPTELYWAYEPVRYLYQQLKLDTLSQIPKHSNFHIVRFIHGNELCDLQKSEGFYLWHLLSKSKEVFTPLVKKYEVQFYEKDLLKKIETDGRFYRFTFANGSYKTYDLGYDFIKENSFESKFREKGKYD